MRQAEELFQALTAGEVMSRTVLVLPDGMSVVGAARLLLERRLSAAPVVDAPGRCVGVLSAADLLAWAADEARAGEGGPAPAECVWCDWQVVGDGPPRRDEVRRHMMRDPLLVSSDTRLAAVADALLTRPRPVVVVDEMRRPLGVVSKIDLLAVLAPANWRPAAEPPAGGPADPRAPLRRPAQRQRSGTAPTGS